MHIDAGTVVAVISVSATLYFSNKNNKRADEQAKQHEVEFEHQKAIWQKEQQHEDDEHIVELINETLDKRKDKDKNGK